MKCRKFRPIGYAWGALLAVIWSAPDIAFSANKPMLMAGKKSLYQRVISRPQAKLHWAADVASAEGAKPVTPFSVFYVYAREGDWVLVGDDSRGGINGWIKQDQLIEWKQALTVTFKEPVNRNRVLLFKDRDSLKSLIDSYDTGAYQRLREQAESGEVSTDSPVVAIQPKSHTDIREDFYLVPILDHEDAFLGGERALVLEVATVPLVVDKVADAGKPPGDETNNAQPKRYRSGIVFVSDATISMGPYIDATREAIRKIYDSLASSELLGDVSFGVFAYRDNIDVVPALDYVTRRYATLEQSRDPQAFFELVKSIEPAEVSSRDFIEDAFAGVKGAIENTEWSGYDARYIVLITDAGARPAHDPLGATGLDAESLRQLAQDLGIAIWVLHLQTPQGFGDHAAASVQYQRLTSYPGIGHFHYPVTMGSVDEFGSVLKTLAGQITQQVLDTSQGILPVPVPEFSMDVEYKTDQPVSPQQRLSQFQKKVEKLGYAMRMRYLKKLRGEQVPEVFNAWLVDREFENPQREALGVHVLLTRNQLSDLQSVLKKVLDTAEEGLLSPKDFLDDLKSLAASVSRDPAAVSASTRATGAAGANLTDLGYMREYIEGLPYTSELLSISLDIWEEWSAKRQLEFVHQLEAKINYYQAIHDNTDLWTSLDGGSIGGDSVFPIALARLP